MRWRAFIAGLASAATFPLTAVPQTGKTQRVGILMLGNPDPALFLRELADGLRELGYVGWQELRGGRCHLEPQCGDLLKDGEIMNIIRPKCE